MTTRREAREWVVQLLFELDMNKREPAEAFESFWEGKNVDDSARAFAEKHVSGVMENLPAIDERIAASAEHWDVKRMSIIDRNVMRMAVYEMLMREDIPAAVSINEAVDLAKYFNTKESGRFVNGILDRIRKDFEEPNG